MLPIKTLSFAPILWLTTLLFIASACQAQSADKSAAGGGGNEVVAYIDKQPISLSELEAHLAAPLERLETERRQILEKGLLQLVDQRLLSLEAESRDMSLDSLISEEITSKAEVDAAQVDAFYEENKARIPQPKDQVLGQVRIYLEQQKAQGVRADFLKELRASHEVSLVLEPYRADLSSKTPAARRGDEEAPVTLTIFSDFQCPGCRGIEPVIDSIRDSYGEKLAVEFRQFPLISIHPQAFQAAEAALCAGDQGKFWDMHGSLFANQRSLQRTDLDERAQALELDQNAFGTCLDSGAKKQIVEDDLRLGRRLGVSGTPSIFINGRPVDLTNLQGPPQNAIATVIEDELARSAG